MAPKHTRRTLLRFGLASAAVAAFPAVSSASPAPQPPLDCYLVALGTDRDGSQYVIKIVITDGQAVVTKSSDDTNPIPIHPGIANLFRSVMATPEEFAI